MVVEFLKRIFSFDPNSPLLFTQFDFWVFFALVFTLFSLFKNKVLLRNTFIFFVSVFSITRQVAGLQLFWFPQRC